MKSCRYRKSHCGDKTILRPSDLHNGIPSTGTIASLYWIRALILSVYIEAVLTLSITRLFPVYVDNYAHGSRLIALCCEFIQVVLPCHLGVTSLHWLPQWLKKQWWLTHWGRDKMAASSQTTLPNACSWMRVRISIKIPLKFVHKGPINNIPALVQIMAWRRPGDKLLPEPMLDSLLTHICVTWPEWVNVWLA